MLAAPAFAVLAVAIRLTSRGQALYSQQRVGLQGKLFTIDRGTVSFLTPNGTKSVVADTVQFLDSPGAPAAEGESSDAAEVGVGAEEGELVF